MYSPEVKQRLRSQAEQIMSRYPAGHERSALLPMLHLVQSEDGYVSADGITLCAEMLGLSRPEVSAVATFYSQYKRHPNGTYNVGVCTNALCAVMGGDEIWEAVESHLGVGHDETTEDGQITLERLECNAACDYAPVVMVNWEFFDNQTPESTIELVDSLRAGRPVQPTRGPDQVPTFKEISHLLAGFEDGHVDEGPSAGEPSLRGLHAAREHGWECPTVASGGHSSQPAEEVGAEHSSADRPAVTEEDRKGTENGGEDK
ncbi:MAG: NADH-quinone oxidoreductase subunit NuoE [Actinomycetaceae bacterium]|nr:NADH-quinone oxidoreductase subunit NuoE [Actinomycetaceae bacterium]